MHNTHNTHKHTHTQGRYDLVREGVVVLMGTLAAHLEQGDNEVRVASCIDVGYVIGKSIYIHFNI